MTSSASWSASAVSAAGPTTRDASSRESSTTTLARPCCSAPRASRASSKRHTSGHAHTATQGGRHLVHRAHTRLSRSRDQARSPSTQASPLALSSPRQRPAGSRGAESTRTSRSRADPTGATARIFADRVRTAVPRRGPRGPRALATEPGDRRSARERGDGARARRCIARASRRDATGARGALCARARARRASWRASRSTTSSASWSASAVSAAGPTTRDESSSPGCHPSSARSSQSGAGARCAARSA
jgi:hypothetical protein